MQTSPTLPMEAILSLIFTLLIALIFIGVWLTAWGKIFSKAGYSFWMCILMLIPLVNVIALLILAFSRWPIVQELETYRQRYGALQHGFEIAPHGYAAAPGQNYPPAPPPNPS